FGQLLVQTKDLGDAACDLRHLERVRQACAVVIAGRREKDLRLVLEAPERLAMNHAIAVALKRGANGILGFGPDTAAAVGALRGLRRENLMLSAFELLADFGSGHVIVRAA